jgi:ATP-binding cassette, subfamily B, bacterial
MAFMKPRMGKYFTGMIGMALLFSAINVVQALALKMIADAVAVQSLVPLRNGVGMMLLLIVALIVLFPIAHYMYNGSAAETSAETRSILFGHRGRLPIRYFEKHHSSETLTLLTNDIGTMNGLYMGRLRRLIFPFIFGTAAAVPMFILDYRIASALVILNTASVIVNTRFANPIRRISDRIQTKISTLNSRLIDLISGYAVIRLFHIDGVIRKRYKVSNEETTDLQIRRTHLSALLGSSNYFLSMIGTFGVLIVGALMVSAGWTTLGTLFAILHLQNRLSYAFLEVGQYIPEMQTALAGSGRVFDMLDEPAEPESYKSEDSAGAVATEEAGNIASTDRALEMVGIRRISFSYDGSTPVLDQLTLSAKAGETIALVGPSGGGKSTVLKLLLGFYPPDSGEITLAGKPFGEYALSDVRDLMAYVPQDAYIYDGTIEENIRMGRQEASMEEVEAAAKAAYAHEFITELPGGYQSVVGERGARLSGGQRQRIAIARALLKNASILLLDEATSSLDSESELLVQKALDALMKQRTTIVIAHRLSTIEHADMIYYIDQGKVMESGTHEQLLADGMLYREMHRRASERHSA